MKEKFYICRRCGNLIGILHKSNVPMMCCGEKMEALVPNTTEAAGEKHLPVVTVEDGAVHVNVGLRLLQPARTLDDRNQVIFRRTVCSVH